jgi:FtsZ-binding cell division protein ZapB
MLWLGVEELKNANNQLENINVRTTQTADTLEKIRSRM